MYGFIMGLALTTFISVGGNVVEVPADSPQAISYVQESVTDIGNPDNLVSTLSIEETDIETETETVSDGDTQTVVIQQDNTEVIALLNEQVELLAENSSSVSGTINSQVLDMMDRIIDDYPDYYKYAGFRVDSDDSYRTTLYIAKGCTVSNNVITFTDDCVAVNFYRSSTSSYSNYIYYDVSDAPGATVDVSDRSIVYTNALDAYPSLGNINKSDSSIMWLSLLFIFGIVLIVRRLNND